MKQGTLLITGAGGYCGEHACRHFAQLGLEVIAVLRRAPQAGKESQYESAKGMRTAGNIRIEECDLTDSSAITALVQKIKPQYVLHLAGRNAAGPSWDEPVDYMMNNVMGTIHLLEAVRASVPTSRIVIAGSMLRFPLPSNETVPQPPHPYSASKTIQVLAAQCWSTLYGLDIIIAEPCNLIGPGKSTGLCTLMARYAAACEKAAIGSGAGPTPFKLSSKNECRDFLDVRDAITAYQLLFEQGSSDIIYPIASGKLYSLGEIAEQFQAIARCPLVFDIGSSNAASPTAADTSAISQLGWQPLFPLRRSLEDTLLHMRTEAAQV